MITGWPSTLAALSASERMVMSVGPPAGKAMTSLMGLLGKFFQACAWAVRGATSVVSEASAAAPSRERRNMERSLIVAGAKRTIGHEPPRGRIGDVPGRALPRQRPGRHR